MLKLFSIFKDGFIAIFTSPFWLLYLIYKMIICLILFFKNAFIGIFKFFKGYSIFVTKNDRAIKALKEQDQKMLDQRREEALKNVDL